MTEKLSLDKVRAELRGGEMTLRGPLSRDDGSVHKEVMGIISEHLAGVDSVLALLSGDPIEKKEEEVGGLTATVQELVAPILKAYLRAQRNYRQPSKKESAADWNQFFHEAVEVNLLFQGLGLDEEPDFIAKALSRGGARYWKGLEEALGVFKDYPWIIKRVVQHMSADPLDFIRTAEEQYRNIASDPAYVDYRELGWVIRYAVVFYSSDPRAFLDRIGDDLYKKAGISPRQVPHGPHGPLLKALVCNPRLANGRPPRVKKK